MKRLTGVIVVVLALGSGQVLAQAVAQPDAKSTSSFEKSAFSKNGNSFARERGLAKPVAGATSNDIKAFYGQQAGGLAYTPAGAPRGPGVESSDR